jgi:DNA (cytosine-5)-methyltransferase 1
VLTVGSLFAGIGGFDLAAERAGLTVKWQVEIDPFCQRVLAKHWPNVKRYGDIKRVRYPAPVDIICGGFPCQDISSNNQYKRGISGGKSGLWREMVRIIRAVRPRYVVVENVADLLVRGMGVVLGELAALGYDAEWDCFPAASFGLPQPRWRVFVIAYPGGGRRETGHQRLEAGPLAFARIDDDGLVAAEHEAAACAARVGRMDDGLPGRMDRVGACGNSVSPQVAEWIFRRIIEAHGEASGLQKGTE